jgi:hypothetical protein
VENPTLNNTSNHLISLRPCSESVFMTAKGLYSILRVLDQFYGARGAVIGEDEKVEAGRGRRGNADRSDSTCESFDSFFVFWSYAVRAEGSPAL